jgi:hypothetical protein
VVYITNRFEPPVGGKRVSQNRDGSPTPFVIGDPRPAENEFGLPKGDYWTFVQ